MGRGTKCSRRRFGGRCRLELAGAALALLSASVQSADPVAAPGQALRQPSAASVSVEAKLDRELILALKQSRGEPPYDKASPAGSQPQPDIPIKDASGGVLVDIAAPVSSDLLRSITASGGRLAPSPDPVNVARAMVPLGALEALAHRHDVISIAPARLERINRLEHEQRTPGDVARPNP